MDGTSHALNLRPLDIDEAWDAAAILVRVAVFYLGCLWAFPFVGHHLHGSFLPAPWGMVAAWAGGVAALAICRDSWRSVLVGLWWWTGGNRGVVEETRAAMGRALTDKEAWAFATAHKEVIGRFIWLSQDGGWVLMGATLQPHKPNHEEHVDDRRYALDNDSIRLYPQHKTGPRFHAHGWRGALERWLLPNGAPLFIDTAPFQGGSHHALVRAMALFTTPVQKAL